MDGRQAGNDEQVRMWNGAAGRAWVDARDVLDQMLDPFTAPLVEAALASRGRVLDVGCGAGSTTLALATVVGAGNCLGVDVSGPLIDAARARADRERVAVRFIRADAEDHAFDPAMFDTIVSRFGVMFFGDAVRAFTNLRHAAKADATMRFIAWRSADENPFMTTAERAAATLLPDVPPRVPDAPGQFAFARAPRVRSILEHAGWVDVDVRPLDRPCTFPEAALKPYLARFGPLGRVLQEVDDSTRTRVVDAVRGAFEPYVHGSEVRFSAACWMVDARNVTPA